MMLWNVEILAAGFWERKNLGINVINKYVSADNTDYVFVDPSWLWSHIKIDEFLSWVPLTTNNVTISVTQQLPYPFNNDS